ncbi:MAG: hypothetical protein RLZZ201_1278 [Actinomycetota bacterium]
MSRASYLVILDQATEQLCTDAGIDQRSVVTFKRDVVALGCPAQFFSRQAKGADAYARLKLCAKAIAFILKHPRVETKIVSGKSGSIQTSR